MYSVPILELKTEARRVLRKDVDYLTSLVTSNEFKFSKE